MLRVNRERADEIAPRGAPIYIEIELDVPEPGEFDDFDLEDPVTEERPRAEG